MAKSTGMGWFKESRRHALAARGIRSGVKSSSRTMYQIQQDVGFLRDAPYNVDYLPDDSDNWVTERGFETKEQAEKWAKSNMLDDDANEVEIYKDSPNRYPKKYRRSCPKGVIKR